MTELLSHDFEQFREETEAELDELTKLQTVAFARRCALHALPYLYSIGDMAIWSHKKRSQHSYAIFNVLDICHVYVEEKGFDKPIEEVAYTNAARAVKAVNADHDYVANASAKAAIAAVFATSCTTYAANAADAAARAAYCSCAIDIRTVLHQDLQDIANNQTPTGKIDYPSQLWQNFQQALINEDCGYWARLYQQIFENNFEVDAQELELRLNVPIEIKAQGAAAVGHYLEQIAQGIEQLNESRIVILGDKGAGKTCLARRLVDPNAYMTTPDESTAGVATTIWTLAETDTKVRIWDFAGHTVTHAVHQFFLSERCLYILVYDGRTDNTQRLEYWLDHMKNYGGDSKAVIVVNEKDQHKVAIPINKLKEKYAIDSVYYLSIADVQQMADFRVKIADLISHNSCWNKQQIPSRYYQAKAELEQLFSHCSGDNPTDDESANNQSLEYIKFDRFKRIAANHNIDNAEQLLKDLNALGVCLWYPELAEFDKLVFSPEWISHGVYQIINWVANQRNCYAISLDDFSQVFSNDTDAKCFAVEHHSFLFRLIEHYELAYRSQSDEQTLIIPHLLQEDQPATEDLPSFDVSESLMLEYKAEHPLPPHTISRFIVRHNKQIKHNLVWRVGVVLADSDATALVKEDDRTISIKVKGTNKQAFIVQLRDTMNAIFASFKSDKPEVLYRVIPYDEFGQVVELKNALMLSERKLVSHAIQDQSYFDDVTGEFIDAKPTVNIYSMIDAKFLIQSDEGHQIHVDNSNHIYDYQDCNFALQSSLKDLAIELLATNQQQHAQELQNAILALEQAEDCETPEEVKKSGFSSRMTRLLQDMGDKNSNLHKVIEGTKNGVSIAQDLAAKYNGIAQWAGLPQVPKPFLK